MREIKFKLYLQNEETGAITSVEFNYAQIFSGLAKEILEKNYRRWFVIANCQFTGLHDKNGEEIYEGYVVRYFTCENEKGEVWLYKPGYPAPLSWLAEITFKDGAFGVKNSLFEGKKGATWSVEGTQHQPNQRNWEVIGNIYENPKLLGV